MRITGKNGEEEMEGEEKEVDEEEWDVLIGGKDAEEKEEVEQEEVVCSLPTQNVRGTKFTAVQNLPNPLSFHLT